MIPNLNRASTFLGVRNFLFFAAVVISSTALDTKEVPLEQGNVDKHNMKVGENRLAAQIFTLLEHYKQDDPVGIPIAPIQDPMDVPDMSTSFGLATLDMKGMKSYGISKFRVKNVRVDLKAMEAEGVVTLDEMLTEGNYTLSSFLSESEGPFHVTLLNVTVLAKVNLTVQLDGQLMTDSIFMNITFKEMKTDFQNLGYMTSIFQSVTKSAPNLLFDVMKPYIMKEADVKMRGEIDGIIKKIVGDRRFPHSISILDTAFAEARKKVREMGYDPIYIPDYKENLEFFSVSIHNTVIGGVSSFYRVGDIILSMKNNTVSSKFGIGIQKIYGSTGWKIGMRSGLYSRAGYVQFSVDQIKVGVNVSQALDTRKHPKINELEINLGTIVVTTERAGVVDHIMEFILNVLPNLLRHQITEIIEYLLMTRIQKIFDQINLENAIKENLHKFELFEALATEKGPINFDFKF